MIAIENVRLFKELQTRNAELTEALEQQTATANILRIISSSPTDTQPVFAAIVSSAVPLFGGLDVSLRLVNEDRVELVASTRPDWESTNAPITVPGPSQLAIARKQTLQFRDFTEVADHTRHLWERRGIGASVVTPLMRGDEAIGTLGVSRAMPGPFTDSQLALLRTFADQAVIAIENVRLFKELEARNAELTESLQQQTVTSEILRIISRSPTDTQPVFDAIVNSGATLFRGMQIGLRLVKGDYHERVASTIDPDSPRVTRGELRIPLNDPSRAQSRAILRRQVVQTPDILADETASPSLIEQRRQRPFRGMVAVPLIRDKEAIGVINVMRKTPGPFTDKQIALLKTFADQAVIAIENEHLFKELQARNTEVTEALEQQTATANILKVISGSPTDTQPVFDAIVQSGIRLFHGASVVLRLVRDDRVERVSSAMSPTFEGTEDIADVSSLPLYDGNFSGRAIVRREIVHVSDVLTEDWADADAKAIAERRGYRAIVAVPLLREDRAIGTIVVVRASPGPFTPKELALLQTFADQAVIAIENVRLFNELQAKNAELTESLEQQTATAEILKVISKSPTDTQPVFDAIVESGSRLFGGARVGINLRNGSALVRKASASNLNQGAIDDSVYVRSAEDDSFPGPRAMMRREVVDVPDFLTEAWVNEGPKERAKREGRRAITHAPLLSQSEAIGTINVSRVHPGPLPSAQITLLKTFADQAVIAIENVRLFNETKEALERQMAISEILRVISSSPTDVQPVLDTVVERAAQICEANDVRVWLLEGHLLRYVAGKGPFDIKIGRTWTLDRGLPVTRAVIDRATVHVEDMSTPAAQAEFPLGYQQHQRRGYRTFLAMPLLQKDRVLGALLLRRTEVRPFTDKQVDLLKTFSDQAAIAIENVRLFNEIENKSRQLEIANRHKSEFLANMSHELRTPLNAVIGFSEVLQQGMVGELNEKQGEYINYIHTSGSHLLSLINDILDLSKVEAGRMELDLATFGVPLAIDNALTLIKERATRHGLTLECSLDPAVAEIHADERKFKQVMLNLLSNAVKFTPEGGSITVAARPVDGMIEVSVTDTGIGIAPEDCETVFEEFRQVGTHAEGKAQGTGLGLALTKKFIELHGGRIWLTSTPGKGSTFSFTLPNSRPEAQTVAD